MKILSFFQLKTDDLISCFHVCIFVVFVCVCVCNCRIDLNVCKCVFLMCVCAACQYVCVYVEVPNISACVLIDKIWTYINLCV